MFRSALCQPHTDAEPVRPSQLRLVIARSLLLLWKLAPQLSGAFRAHSKLILMCMEHNRTMLISVHMRMRAEPFRPDQLSSVAEQNLLHSLKLV